MWTNQQVASSLDELSSPSEGTPSLVFVFGAISKFDEPGFVDRLAGLFPKDVLVGCTTAGEISDNGVSDDTLVVTSLGFASTKVRIVSTDCPGIASSEAAGAALGEQLPGDGLTGIILLAKGLDINGSALIDGVVSKVGASVPISGGLAGDGGAFQRTLVLGPDGLTETGVIAIGLYGEALGFRFGSFGGWEPFGPVRKVTRCEGNILFELDGEPALNVYKRYLGEYAKDLPASGLLFPFEMLDADHSSVGLIRTILGIDEDQGSLTLAGAIEQEGFLRLMHASTDALIVGAENAAEAARKEGGEQGDGFGLLVSCVGRKLVMGDQTEEEVEGVADVLGKGVTLTGFYSYGEISPMRGILDCKLHNQTMTIAYLFED